MIRILSAVFVIMVAPMAAAEEDWRTDPTAFIYHFAQVGVDDILTADATTEEKRARFRELFNEGFDIPAIGRFVLARNWRRADETQQAEFTRLFEDVIVYTWARRFGEYDGQTIEVRGTTPDGETGTLVDSAIIDTNGQTIAVQWRLRLRDEGLRIVDIIVEGVSMAITYRQDYGSAIRQSGGLDGLLTQLQNQVEQLANS